METIKPIVFSAIAAIIIGAINYIITKRNSVGKNYAVYLKWLHIVSPIIGAYSVWGINIFLYGMNIYSFAFMIPWGFIYWIFYDWTLGLLLTGNIFHVGTTGIDKYLIQIFQDGVQYSFMKAIMALLTWSGVNYFYTL